MVTHKTCPKKVERQKGQFQVVNTWLVHALDLGPGVLLSFLINWYERFEKMDAIKNDWFFATQTTIHLHTSIPARSQTRYLKLLQNHNLVEVRLKRNPNRRFIRLNIDKINQLINNTRDEYCSNRDNELSNTFADAKNADNVVLTEGMMLEHRKFGLCSVSKIIDNSCVKILDIDCDEHTVFSKDLKTIPDDDDYT